MLQCSIVGAQATLRDCHHRYPCGLAPQEFRVKAPVTSSGPHNDVSRETHIYSPADVQE